MPKFVPKPPQHDEPDDTRAWPAWALARLREARAGGAQPPRFRQANEWAFWELRRLIWSDADLRGRVHIEPLARRVEWCQPPGDDDAEL